MFYNSTTVHFKIEHHFNTKNHFNKFKTKRDSSHTNFNLFILMKWYITIIVIKVVSHWIRRKPLLQTLLMLILNNLTRHLTLSIVVVVPIIKLNLHSITKETLISHKKSLWKKLISKTHKMIFSSTIN